MKNNSRKFYIIGSIVLFIMIVATVILIGTLPNKKNTVYAAEDDVYEIVIERNSAVSVYVKGSGVKLINTSCPGGDGHSDYIHDLYTVEKGTEITLISVNESRIFKDWNINEYTYQIVDDVQKQVLSPHDKNNSTDPQITFTPDSHLLVSVDRRDPTTYDVGRYMSNRFLISEAKDLFLLQEAFRLADNVTSNVMIYDDVKDPSKDVYILDYYDKLFKEDPVWRTYTTDNQKISAINGTLTGTNPPKYFERLQSSYFLVDQNFAYLDVDNNMPFLGIGNSADTAFKGVFSGNTDAPSTISLIIQDNQEAGTNYYGLFGYLDNTAVVRNLEVQTSIGIERSTLEIPDENNYDKYIISNDLRVQSWGRTYYLRTLKFTCSNVNDYNNLTVQFSTDNRTWHDVTGNNGTYTDTSRNYRYFRINVKPEYHDQITLTNVQYTVQNQADVTLGSNHVNSNNVVRASVSNGTVIFEANPILTGYLSTVYIGGLAGYNNNAFLYNINSNARISADLSCRDGSAIYAGGIAGSMTGGIESYANVVANGNSSGWVIQTNNNKSSVYTGLVAGYASNTYVNDISIDVSEYAATVKNSSSFAGNFNVYMGNLFGQYETEDDNIGRKLYLRNIRIYGDSAENISALINRGNAYASGLIGQLNSSNKDVYLGSVKFQISNKSATSRIIAQSISSTSEAKLYTSGLFANIIGDRTYTTTGFNQGIIKDTIDDKTYYRYNFIFNANLYVESINNGACSDTNGLAISGGLVGKGLLVINGTDELPSNILLSPENYELTIKATQTSTTSSNNTSENVVDHCIAGLTFGYYSTDYFDYTYEYINIYSNNSKVIATRELSSKAIGDIHVGGFSAYINRSNISNINLYLNNTEFRIDSLSYDATKDGEGNSAFVGAAIGELTNDNNQPSTVEYINLNGYDYSNHSTIGHTVKITSIQNSQPTAGTNYSSENYAGGIIGRTRLYNIYNLSNNGSETEEDYIQMQGHQSPDSAFCGGIIAFVQHIDGIELSLESCRANNLTIYCGATVTGGIDDPDVFAGAIVGAVFCTNSNSTYNIRKCYVEKCDVIGIGNDRIRLSSAGILGYIAWSGRLNISGCYVYGSNISSSYNANTTYNNEAHSCAYSGGILGRRYNTNGGTNVSISNCSVIDTNITSDGGGVAYRLYAAGISHEGTITNCYTNAYIDAFNCYENDKTSDNYKEAIHIYGIGSGGENDSYYVSQNVSPSSGNSDNSVGLNFEERALDSNSYHLFGDSANGNLGQNYRTNYKYYLILEDETVFGISNDNNYHRISSDTNQVGSNYVNVWINAFNTTTVHSDDYPTSFDNDILRREAGWFNLGSIFIYKGDDKETNTAAEPTLSFIDGTNEYRFNKQVNINGKYYEEFINIHYPYNTILNFDFRGVSASDLPDIPLENLGYFRNRTYEKPFDNTIGDKYYQSGQLNQGNNYITKLTFDYAKNYADFTVEFSNDGTNWDVIERTNNEYLSDNDKEYKYIRITSATLNNAVISNIKYYLNNDDTSNDLPLTSTSKKNVNISGSSIEFIDVDGYSRVFSVLVRDNIPTIKLVFIVPNDTSLLSPVFFDNNNNPISFNEELGSYTFMHHENISDTTYIFTYTPNKEIEKDKLFYVKFRIGNTDDTYLNKGFGFDVIANSRSILHVVPADYTPPVNHTEFVDSNGLIIDSSTNNPYFLRYNSTTKFIPVFKRENDLPIGTTGTGDDKKFIYPEYNSELNVDYVDYKLGTAGTGTMSTNGEFKSATSGYTATYYEMNVSLKDVSLKDESNSYTLYYRFVNNVSVTYSSIGSEINGLTYATSDSNYVLESTCYDHYGGIPKSFNITIAGHENSPFDLNKIMAMEWIKNQKGEVLSAWDLENSYYKLTIPKDDIKGAITIEIEFNVVYTIKFDLQCASFNNNYKGDQILKYKVIAGETFKSFFIDATKDPTSVDYYKDTYKQVKSFMNGAVSVISGYLCTGFFLVDEANSQVSYGVEFDELADTNIKINTSYVFYARWNFLIELVEAPGTHIESSFADSFMIEINPEDYGEHVNRQIAIPINVKRGFVFTVVKDEGFIGEADVKAYIIDNKNSSTDTITEITIQKYHENMYLYFIPPEEITGYLVIVTSVTNAEVIVGEHTAQVVDEILPEDGIYTFKYIVNHRNTIDANGNIDQSFIYDSGLVDEHGNSVQKDRNLQLQKNVFVQFFNQDYNESNHKVEITPRNLVKGSIVEVYYSLYINNSTVASKNIVGSYIVNSDSGISSLMLSDFNQLNNNVKAFSQDPAYTNKNGVTYDAGTYGAFLKDYEYVSEVYYFVVTPPNGYDIAENQDGFGNMHNSLVLVGYYDENPSYTNEAYGAYDKYIKGKRTSKDFANIPIQGNKDQFTVFTKESALQSKLTTFTPSRVTTLEKEDDVYKFTDITKYNLYEMHLIQGDVDNTLNIVKLHDNASKNTIVQSGIIEHGINKLSLELGYSTGKVNIYGGYIDENEDIIYELIDTIEITDISYQKYDVSFIGRAHIYKYFKIDNISLSEIRLKDLILTDFHCIRDINISVSTAEHFKTVGDDKVFVVQSEIQGDERHKGKSFILAVQIANGSTIIEDIAPGTVKLMQGSTELSIEPIIDLQGTNVVYFNLSSYIESLNITSFEFSIVTSSGTVYCVELIEASNAQKPAMGEVRYIIK